MSDDETKTSKSKVSQAGRFGLIWAGFVGLCLGIAAGILEYFILWKFSEPLLTGPGSLAQWGEGGGVVAVMVLIGLASFAVLITVTTTISGYLLGQIRLILIVGIAIPMLFLLGNVPTLSGDPAFGIRFSATCLSLYSVCMIASGALGGYIGSSLQGSKLKNTERN